MNLGVGRSDSPNHSGITSSHPMPRWATSRIFDDGSEPIERRRSPIGPVVALAAGSSMSKESPGSSLAGNGSARNGVEVPLRGVGETAGVTGHQRYAEIARRRDQQSIRRVAMQRAQQSPGLGWKLNPALARFA